MGGKVGQRRLGVRRPPPRVMAQITASADGVVHLATNLRRVDECLLPAVFGALAAHCGLDPAPMEKAVKAGSKGDGRPDPRYPELTTLIAAARRDWNRWGEQLVAAIQEQFDAGKLFPMNPANEHLLNELFRDHEVMFSARFARHHPDLPRYKRLVRDGLVAPGLATASYIDVAYKLGRGLNALQALTVKPGRGPTLASIVRTATTQTLTAQDERALDYATRRAAIYMRRPVEQATLAGHRVLNEEEGAAIRGAVASAVEQHAGWKQLGPKLREAMVGHPSLLNDVDRVARTEIAFAHSFGAYVGLKDQTAKAGHKDPWVYKFAAPGSCTHCKRIWGPPANPTRYRLSEIEAREAAGGNFQLPQKEWGPVIGPVHPNCTEGALQFWDAALVESINRAADDLLQHWHRG